MKILQINIFSEKCTVTVHFRDKTHDMTLSCTHKKIRGQTNFNERLPHALPRQAVRGAVVKLFSQLFSETHGIWKWHVWNFPSLNPKTKTNREGKLPTDLSLSFQHIHFGRCSENDGLLHVVDLDANSWPPIFQRGNCWMWSPQNSADRAVLYNALWWNADVQGTQDGTNATDSAQC